jgi:hypothetical protein
MHTTEKLADVVYVRCACVRASACLHVTLPLAQLIPNLPGYHGKRSCEDIIHLHACMSYLSHLGNSYAFASTTSPA